MYFLRCDLVKQVIKRYQREPLLALGNTGQQLFDLLQDRPQV
jgi:hypothetical protein